MMRYFREVLLRLASASIAFGIMLATSNIAKSQSEMVKLDAYTAAFRVGGQYTTITGLDPGNPPTNPQASLVRYGLEQQA
jgi:hypothetical protein